MSLRVAPRATKQSSGNEEIASVAPLLRNDMKEMA